MLEFKSNCIEVDKWVFLVNGLAKQFEWTLRLEARCFFMLRRLIKRVVPAATAVSAASAPVKSQHLSQVGSTARMFQSLKPATRGVAVESSVAAPVYTLFSNAEAYAFQPFLRPKAPHEQALVNGLGLIGIKALQFLNDGENLELEEPHGAIAFLEERADGLEKLKITNPVASKMIEKLQQLVATVAPKKGISSIFNPKPSWYDTSHGPSPR